MKGLFFACGYQTVGCSAAERTSLLNLCLHEQIVYRDFCTAEDGSVRFTVSLYTARRLKRLCQMRNIALTLGARGGLPWLAVCYRRRVGLMLGVLVAVALMILSQRFIWDVRISGNEELTRAQVLEELGACGFGIGSYIPDLQTEVVENRVLLASERIAWISLYVDGTVAKVQIIENKAPPTPPSHKPANLVAAVDGQIESVELLRGNCMVAVGQAVRAGELLVSGLYDSNAVGYRYTRAAGRILARTERTVTVNIPLHYDQKESGDPKINQTDLNFFGFSIKIFKSTGNLPISYDIIYKNIELDLPFVSSLPVGWRVTYAVPYEIRAEERTQKEALELAYAALESELAAVSGDVMLLSKEIRTEIGEDGVVLTCTLRCIEDIARQIEFEITE